MPKKKSVTKAKKTKKAAPKAAKAAAPKKKVKAKAATKKPAAKKKPAMAKKPYVAPKVSPLKGMSPDDWAGRLQGWHADALRIIRALVTRHAPAATLAIKWGQPVWEQNGPFAWAKPSAGHFSFGFWRGAELEDPGGHLEGEGDRMRHVKIKSAGDLDTLPLEGYVKQAVALNDAKGDPTKR
jgi:hypothetical protein